MRPKYIIVKFVSLNSNKTRRHEYLESRSLGREADIIVFALTAKHVGGHVVMLFNAITKNQKMIIRKTKRTANRMLCFIVTHLNMHYPEL